MGKLARRLRYWIHRREIEQELAEEIELHRELRQTELERKGLSPANAAFDSRKALGNALLAREDARGVWISPLLDQLWQDVVYGLRQLLRNPGYTFIAVVTLAIGIAANSAMFTIVNGVLLEGLPYRDPQQLVLLFEKLPNAPFKFGVSPPDFEILRNDARSFTGMAAYQTVSYELSGVSEPQRLPGARVSPELFSILGITPGAGRMLTPDDDRQQSHVAVLSDGLWYRAFNRDPGVIGRAILLDRQPYTVVGIMPRTIAFPPRGAELNGEPADVFVPISFSQVEREGFGMRYSNTVVARLKPDVSLSGARAEIQSLLKPLADHYPTVLAPFLKGFDIPIIPFNEEVVGRSRRMLLVLMGAVAIVLLIGCADIANLILTRSSSRQSEIAIRVALGAGPSRITRQLLTESLTLATLGGAAGLFLAYFSLRMLLRFAGVTLPRAESIAFNYRVIAFTVAVSLLTPLVFATLPALRTAFARDTDVLQHQANKATPSRARARLLGTMVVAQVALALILSVGAGLLVRSFLFLMRTDPGFRAEQVVRVTATLPSGRYGNGPPIRAFYQQSLETVSALPGIVAAGVGNDLPLGVRERRAFTPENPAHEIPQNSRFVAPTWTSPAYFQALGIPLKRGRVFIDGDTRESQPVIIINEVLARMAWPDEDPVGRRIKWGIDGSEAPWMTIVGVVGDVKQSTLDAPTVAQVYVPLTQVPLVGDLYRTVNLVVRSNREADSLLPELRNAMRKLDADLPVKTQLLTDMIDESLKPQRFSMSVVMLFAAIALGLSAIGIYGVLANVVSQQTHEIGVRIALGATKVSVMWMVLRRALRLIAIGIGIGAAGALALTQLMSTLLYEVRPTDGVAFFVAALVLASLAGAASLIPAYRATRVDPLVALKAE